MSDSEDRRDSDGQTDDSLDERRDRIERELRDRGIITPDNEAQWRPGIAGATAVGLSAAESLLARTPRESAPPPPPNPFFAADERREYDTRMAAEYNYQASDFSAENTRAVRENVVAPAPVVDELGPAPGVAPESRPLSDIGDPTTLRSLDRLVVTSDRSEPDTLAQGLRDTLGSYRYDGGSVGVGGYAVLDELAEAKGTSVRDMMSREELLRFRHLSRLTDEGAATPEQVRKPAQILNKAA